jgi:predicted O-methyltransferase YrrM
MPNPREWIEKVVPDKPWTVIEGHRIMSEFLQPHHKVFEWGAGGSTIWMAFRCEHICTVESDKEWFRGVATVAKAMGVWNKITILLRDHEQPSLYANAIDLCADRGPFDMIFIDGKTGTRTACAKRALNHIAEDGMIVLDNSGAEASKEANGILEQAGWVAERHIGPVYDPRRDPADLDKSEIAFFTRQEQKDNG